jgi:spoIIIJ-associated protein
MENLKTVIEELLPLFRLNETRAEFDEENKKVFFHVSDEFISSRNLSEIVLHFNRIFGLIAKKFDEGPIMVDVNNFRREREKFVLELARAGAKKAALSKSDVVLPPMNAYERRLVHTELAIRPDIKTESVGQGSSRQVVIKFLE